MNVQRLNWQPYRIGFAVSAALLSAIFTVIILISSNNRPVDSWFKIRPTVLLAICTVVANIAVHQILAEGLPVRWWLEAKHRDRSADDLRKIYDHGSSTWSSICSFCIAKPSTAAIACLSVTAVASNGPLLQRASHVENQRYDSDVQIATGLAVEWPVGFSGITNVRHAEYWMEPVQAFTPVFAGVVKDFSAQKEIILDNTGCVGSCTAMIQGAGFALDCSQGTYDYNITVDSGVGHAVYVQATGFSSAVSLVAPKNPEDSFIITVSTLFKNSKDADGQGITRNCSLTPSSVLYSVKVENSTVSLLGTIKNDSIVKRVRIVEYAVAGQETLGGLVYVGQQRYNSNAQMEWQGSRQWSIPMNGSLAYEFQNLGAWYPGTTELGISAAMTWGDPTDTIIQGMRELMFRSAIATGNSSLPPSVTMGSMTSSRQIYSTDFLFMGLGVAAIMVSLLGMIPLLWGGWVVREDVDLDPIRVVAWTTALASQGKVMGVSRLQDTQYIRVEVEDKRWSKP